MRKYIITPLLLSLFFLLSAAASATVVPSAVDPILLYKAMQDKHCLQWVDSLLHKLTLKEKIGQLFIYTIAPVETKRNLALLRDAVGTYKVGGLLFSGGKLPNQAQLTNTAQRLSKLPLMITFDGEWGLSMRLRGTPVFPRNMVLGCIQDNRLIYEYGREMARQCRELGVQVNFAPVADVNVNPHNPVINTRSFGENPVQVADKVIAYGSGLEGGGVLSVCKHFPGHGDTDVDSHKALPLIPFTRERLDSVELYPFKEAIRAGLSGMMVGHLQVPVIEPVGGLPSSLSRNIVYGLLTEELAFKGLIFTDALAMKGVSGNESVSLQALKAGNDMVLAPRNLKAEIGAVIEAVEKRDGLTPEEIESKCRKVLIYKYILGLKQKPIIRLSGLANRISTPQARDLVRRLNLAAITVISNPTGILPLHSTLPRQASPSSAPKDIPLAERGEEAMALLEVSDPGEMDAFAARLSQHSPIVRFRLPARPTEAEGKQLRDSLSAYRRLIVAIGEQRLAPYQPFFAHLAAEKKFPPTVYAFFTPGKMMLQVQRAVSAAQAVVLGHSMGHEVQEQVADVLFAKTTANGRLSASIGGLFRAGQGLTITPQTALHFRSEEYGLLSDVLQRIDTIAMEGIGKGAYPGCQVVVLKDGRVMVDKSYGTYTGGVGSNGSTGSVGNTGSAGSAELSPRVESTSIYDLASLSKTTGTLLALMKLYDKGRFSLTDKLSDHLPWLLRTNKKEMTIRDVLFHQSGLPAGIAFYPEAIDRSSYKGKLFSSKRNAQHPLELGPGTWANPHFRFKEAYISLVETDAYALPIGDSLWLNRFFGQVIEAEIAHAPMKEKVYRYSDVGFVLLRLLAERLAGVPMDEYLQRELFGPMGLERTGYLPLRRHATSQVVPSSIDRFLRKQTLQGFVHDETAAFQGGVSGNAGLFSTAGEVARIYQMLLNGGELDGTRYLSEETCRLFTTEVSKVSRRGLGFDKPDTKSPKVSPCAESAPASVYGHTGFTGTCAWVDPENGLVYVFLSNRTYPDATNRKLQQLNIRERIQQTIYEALK